MNSSPVKRTVYLDRGDLININDAITGDVMIRDLHLLDSAITRPRISLFGQPQFPTLADKAAALLHSLAYHHLFVDGNKRTAVMAVTAFLNRNGYAFAYDHTLAADREYLLEVAQGQHDPGAIAAWIAPRMTPVAP